MKKILLVFGDPNSINSEIIFKTWKKINKSIRKKIYVIANYDLLAAQFKKLNYSIKSTLVKNVNEEQNSSKLKIINVEIKFKKPFLISKKNSSIFVKKSLILAHKISLDRNVVGLINCAINKELISNKGLGVTEFLSRKCKVRKDSEVMMIYNKRLSVIPLTTHLDIKRISPKLTKSLIIDKIKTARTWYKKKFNKEPSFGVLGLNPHNSELRLNSEEVTTIIPAIKKIKKIGIKVQGPLVSDTLFINDFKNYDIIVGMYHDQVLAPFKTLFKFDAINITLGLKYLRVSPDHGTAKNLIAKNKANPSSLIYCINFLNKF